MKKSVCIVDYGMGNLFSVKGALDHLGADAFFSSSPDEVMNADRVILPGVGSFGDGIAELKSRSLFEAIKSYATSGKPLMGICLGMQLLLTKSYEMGEHLGLDLIKGKNVLIKTDIRNIKFKVPHIDWEEVRMYNNTLSKNSILIIFVTS